MFLHQICLDSSRISATGCCITVIVQIDPLCRQAASCSTVIPAQTAHTSQWLVLVYGVYGNKEYCAMHCVPKNVHLFIFQITLSKINQL